MDIERSILRFDIYELLEFLKETEEYKNHIPKDAKFIRTIKETDQRLTEGFIDIVIESHEREIVPLGGCLCMHHIHKD